MDIEHISNFKKGWLIGDFDPALIKSKDFEVALKEYSKGDVDVKHYHKIAIEYTIVLRGHCKMQGKELKEGDIAIIKPGEVSGFEALDDTKLLVIKMPSIPHDKYEV